MQSKNDYSLFLKHSGSHMTVVAVYVDDILVTGSNIDDITTLKQHIHSTFGIKDLGHLHYFLGFEVTPLPGGLSLSQWKFTHYLLLQTGFLNSKHAATPLPLHYKLTLEMGIFCRIPLIIGLLLASSIF